MKFTPEEDRLIQDEVSRFGPRCWTSIAAKIPNRTSRQVRERWKNYLCPAVNNGPWTAEEDQLLATLTTQIGPKWSQLVPYFTDRTDVHLKNRFILLERRKRRFVKNAAKLLTVEHRRKLADPASRDAVMPFFQALMEGLPGSQVRGNRSEGLPAEEEQEPGILPWEFEASIDGLGSCGNNYEFDLEPMWI
jgi:hypothetical protein